MLSATDHIDHIDRLVYLATRPEGKVATEMLSAMTGGGSIGAAAKGFAVPMPGDTHVFIDSIPMPGSHHVFIDQIPMPGSHHIFIGH